MEVQEAVIMRVHRGVQLQVPERVIMRVLMVVPQGVLKEVTRKVHMAVQPLAVKPERVTERVPMAVLVAIETVQQGVLQAVQPAEVTFKVLLPAP